MSKSAKKVSRKLLSKAQRSAISRKARYAQLKTMNTKAYQRAANKGRRAIDAFLAKLHA